MMGQLAQLELLFQQFTGGSKSSTDGTFAPFLRSESSRERKFQGAKVLRSESSREQKFHTWNFRSREWMVLGAKSLVAVRQTPKRMALPVVELGKMEGAQSTIGLLIIDSSCALQSFRRRLALYYYYY